MPTTLFGHREMGSVRQVFDLRKHIHVFGNRCSERALASVLGEPRVWGNEKEPWGGSKKINEVFQMAVASWVGNLGK